MGIYFNNPFLVVGCRVSHYMDYLDTKSPFLLQPYFWLLPAFLSNMSNFFGRQLARNTLRERFSYTSMVQTSPLFTLSSLVTDISGSTGLHATTYELIVYFPYTQNCEHYITFMVCIHCSFVRVWNKTKKTYTSRTQRYQSFLLYKPTFTVSRALVGKR